MDIIHKQGRHATAHVRPRRRQSQAFSNCDGLGVSFSFLVETQRL
jgi:hypothetical protein